MINGHIGIRYSHQLYLWYLCRFDIVSMISVPENPIIIIVAKITTLSCTVYEIQAFKLADAILDAILDFGLRYLYRLHISFDEFSNHENDISAAKLQLLHAPFMRYQQLKLATPSWFRGLGMSLLLRYRKITILQVKIHKEH